MKRQIRSLDNSLSCVADWHQPDRYRDLLGLPASGPMAVQGSGLSIAPCGFNDAGRTISMARFNRILDVDLAERWIEAEAGVTLGQFFDFLAPKGFSIGVQPGHPGISLGGCIGGNVHGKNHYREGAFSNQVLSLELFHPAHGLVRCSPDENADLFELTCGGFGLTGFIVSARVRIHPLQGNAMVSGHAEVGSIIETIRRLDAIKDSVELAYSWNDMSRFDAKFGRGFVVTSKLVTLAEAPATKTSFAKLSPFYDGPNLPLLNRYSLPTVNALYFALNRKGSGKPTSILNAFFPWITKGLYFYSFGAGGVIEPQVLVPMTAIDDYCKAFETIVKKHRQPFAVASFKIFKGEQRLVRFDGTGVSFSLQINNTPGTRAMLAELDQVNTSFGAITNLLKDCRLSEQVARDQYPDFDTFRARLHAFDPDRIFKTFLSERLGL